MTLLCHLSKLVMELQAGTVLVYVSHGTPIKSNVRPVDVPEMLYTLADYPKENEISTSIRVDFGAKATLLSTGDIVHAPLTLELTTDEAALIGLGKSRRDAVCV